MLFEQSKAAIPPVFLIPDLLEYNRFNKILYDLKGEWMDNDDNNEQFVFDLRTAQEKELQASFKTRNAFKKKFEIWEDRPKIIDSEELKEDEADYIQYISSTVHLLEDQNLILHVKSMIQPSQVVFDFFES